MRKKNTFGKLGGMLVEVEDIRNFEIIEYEDPITGDILSAIEIEYLDGEYQVIPYSDWNEFEEDVEWLDRYME